MKKSKYLDYIIIAVLVLAVSGCTALCIQRISKRKEMMNMAQAKVVLYEGPKSLRDANADDLKAAAENAKDFSLLHCTDTQVSVNGKECYVYDTNVNHTRQWVGNYLPPISRTPVTYFDFEGTVVVTVTVPDRALDCVTISPLSYQLNPTVDKKAHTVSFIIDTPDTYTLTFDDSPERALHIFANPLETDIPDFTDEKVIYVGPGEWNIQSISMESGQTLYIAGGAVIHGIVNGNFVDHVKVMGRGILDCSAYEGWKGTTAYIPLKFDNCSDITLQDVIVLNANAWVCQANESKNGVIDGIKIISPRPNGDGITLQSCENYQIKNCFVRTWDDSLVVKNYGSSSKDITFSNMQLWTDLAQSMEVGYETNKGNQKNATLQNVTFENITVLNNFHKPVISVHNADDAAVSAITFRNITVENAQMGSGDGDEMPYLIDLNIAQSTNWSSTKERGTISDITIDGVKVLFGRFNASRIKGFDETHRVENVKISNLNILGKEIHTFEEGQFEIDAATTDGLFIE